MKKTVATMEALPQLNIEIDECMSKMSSMTNEEKIDKLTNLAGKYVAQRTELEPKVLDYTVRSLRDAALQIGVGEAAARRYRKKLMDFRNETLNLRAEQELEVSREPGSVFSSLARLSQAESTQMSPQIAELPIELQKFQQIRKRVLRKLDKSEQDDTSVATPVKDRLRVNTLSNYKRARSKLLEFMSGELPKPWLPSRLAELCDLEIAPIYWVLEDLVDSGLLQRRCWAFKKDNGAHVHTSSICSDWRELLTKPVSCQKCNLLFMAEPQNVALAYQRKDDEPH